jgi:hypothetical protein
MLEKPAGDELIEPHPQGLASDAEVSAELVEAPHVIEDRFAKDEPRPGVADRVEGRKDGVAAGMQSSGKHVG